MSTVQYPSVRNRALVAGAERADMRPHEREASDRTVRSVHIAGARTVVDEHMRRIGMRRVDRVHRQRRLIVMYASDERLDRVATVRRLAVRGDGERRGAGDREGRGGVPGHLARGVRGEGDRALTAGVRVRTSTRTRPRRRRMVGTVRVGQREVDVLTRRRDEAVPVTDILLQRHRERMRAPTSLVAFGAIRIRAFTHVFTAGPEFAPVPSVFRVKGTPPTVTVVCALTVVTPVTAEDRPIVQEPVPPAVVHGFVVVTHQGRYRS